MKKANGRGKSNLITRLVAKEHNFTPTFTPHFSVRLVRMTARPRPRPLARGRGRAQIPSVQANAMAIRK